MGIVEINSALLTLVTLACAVGAYFYALEASFLDILAVESALYSARLESAQAAQDALPYIPHTYCAVVDVAWLLERSEAQARLGGEGMAGVAGEAMERALEAITMVARAYRGAPLAPSAPRTLTLAPSASMYAPSAPLALEGTAPSIPSAPSAARLESIAPVATLSPTVAPSAPISFGAALPRPARLPLTLLAASAPRLESAPSAPKSPDAAGESGIRALRPAAPALESLDAWGRPERARLSASELFALRGASLRPELERAS